MKDNKEVVIIENDGWKREKCVKCEKPAHSVCPNCGTLCGDHDAVHRHETGHITTLLNWQEAWQPMHKTGENN